jgi:hypothetical protein
VLDAFLPARGSDNPAVWLLTEGWPQTLQVWFMEDTLTQFPAVVTLTLD